MIGRVLKGAWRGAVHALADVESGWETLGGTVDLPSTGRMSNAGQTVTAERALKLSAAWACVRSNAQLIGSLPLAIYEKQSDGQKVRIEPDLAEILTIRPNQTQTGMEYWESRSSQIALTGNAYCERLEIGRRLVGLRPLQDVTPKRRPDGRYNYHVRENGKTTILPPEKVFHQRGFGAGNGLGLSTIKYGVESIGAALAADETSSRMFDNGMMASGILTSDQLLDEKQRGQLNSWLEQFVGSKRAGKVLTLEAGLSFQQMNINPEDAQLLDTRRFSVEDICRWFGTPPIIIGHAGSGQTMWGSGVEAIMLAWLTLGINPQLRRKEARLNRDIVPIEKRGKWSVEWNREAMLQMDSKSKAEFLTKLTNAGIQSPDESRDRLELPRRGGAADELHAQSAMAPLVSLGKD